MENRLRWETFQNLHTVCSNSLSPQLVTSVLRCVPLVSYLDSLGDTERQTKHSLTNIGSCVDCGRWTKPPLSPQLTTLGVSQHTSFMHQPYVTWIRKWLVMLGFTWDENSCLLGKSHVRDLPFNSNLNPLWVLSSFGKNITLWHLLNLPITDMDGFTLLVH